MLRSCRANACSTAARLRSRVSGFHLRPVTRACRCPDQYRFPAFTARRSSSSYLSVPYTAATPSSSHRTQTLSRTLGSLAARWWRAASIAKEDSRLSPNPSLTRRTSPTRPTATLPRREPEAISVPSGPKTVTELPLMSA